MNVSKKDKVMIISIIISLLMVSLYIIYNVFEILKYKEGLPKDIVYISNVNDREDYTIYLKPNNFINNIYVPDSLSYITSLVQYIETRFYYEHTGNSNVKVNYTYRVTANIIAEYIDETSKRVSNPIWNKEFMIVRDTRGTSDNSNIKIDEVFNLNLDYYNNLVSDFINDLNIPVNARLEVKFMINIDGTLKNKIPLSKEHYITMTIPLNVKAFDISTFKNIMPKEITYSKTPKKPETSYMLAIIYIGLLLVIIGVSIYFIRHILNRSKNPYILEINKLLKEYNDRIVTVSNFINYEKLEIVDMSSFEELLNFSDETLEPIIYWEKKEKHNKEAWFSILRNRILYRYIIRYEKK